MLNFLIIHNAQKILKSSLSLLKEIKYIFGQLNFRFLFNFWQEVESNRNKLILLCDWATEGAVTHFYSRTLWWSRCASTFKATQSKTCCSQALKIRCPNIVLSPATMLFYCSLSKEFSCGVQYELRIPGSAVPMWYNKNIISTPETHTPAIVYLLLPSYVYTPQLFCNSHHWFCTRFPTGELYLNRGHYCPLLLVTSF